MVASIGIILTPRDWGFGWGGDEGLSFVCVGAFCYCIGEY